MRKRPFLSMACFFLLGILWRVNGTIAYSVGMLAVLLYCINHLRRQRRWLRLAGRSVLLLSVFLAGYFHMSQNLAFRQEYMGRLKDGDTITIQGEIYKKEFKNQQYLYYLTDCAAVHSKRNIQTNSVIAYFKEDNYSIGQILLIKGNVKLFSEARNEGNFDMCVYYQSQKIDFGVASGKVKQVAGERNGFSEKMYQLKIRLESVFETCLNKEDAGVLSVMLLGDKSALDTEVRSLYQKAGISHILAISGLHVSLIGLGVYHLLRKCRCRYKMAGVIASGFLISYGIMTGMGISTQRAIGMFLLTMLGLLVERSYDLLNGLGVMALYLLCCNPFLIAYSGFVFSFMAILGVGVTGKILCQALGQGVREEKHSAGKSGTGKIVAEKSIAEKSIAESEHGWSSMGRFGTGNESVRRSIGKTSTRNKPGKKRRNEIYNTVIMSIGIQLTTLPLVAYYYYEIPLYAILINLIVIPPLSIVVGFGFMGGLAGLVTTRFPVILFIPCRIILACYTWICSMCEKLPCSQYITGQPDRWKLIVYYSVLAGGLYWIHRNITRTASQMESKNNCCNEKDSVKKRYGNENEEVKNRKKRCGDENEGVKKRFADKNNGMKSRCSDKNNGMKSVGGRKEIDRQYFKKRIIVVWMIFLIVLLVWRKPADFELNILDVGQGDGIYLQTSSGVSVFFDGGSSDVKEVGKYRILPFLKAKGVPYISYWFVSHGDSDHITGLLEVLEEGYPVHVLVLSAYMPRDEAYVSLMEAAEKNDTQIMHFRPGDSITAGDAKLSCLYPGKESSGHAKEDRNALSQVILYEDEEFTGLFAGDLDAEGEKALCRYVEKREIDYLKAVHHGSNFSNTRELFDAFSPDIITISCGLKNSYGHPGEEAVQRMEKTGADIYETMHQGQIRIGKDREIAPYIEMAR